MLDPQEMGDQMTSEQFKIMSHNAKINNAIDAAISTVVKPQKDLSFKLQVKVQKTDALRVIRK